MDTFFTRKGDDGTTGVLGEGRLPKHHLRMEALGSLDEATAALGLSRAMSGRVQTQTLLARIQNDLYQMMAEVAATPENALNFRAIDAKRVTWLEDQIKRLSGEVQIPKEFILPGETPVSGALALARTITRRAERRVSELLARQELANQDLLRYLNRLSSLIFVLEIQANQQAGKPTQFVKK
ncbi:MAG: cob(I)yrinic acid a,c-diamide adenosyltransferase [Anaerolineales bacterium]|nr:cob(I)yrinic acid a,c-diamide adenosyltransferase [Anaerolineales bacterium]